MVRAFATLRLYLFKNRKDTFPFRLFNRSVLVSTRDKTVLQSTESERVSFLASFTAKCIVSKPPASFLLSGNFLFLPLR